MIPGGRDVRLAARLFCLLSLNKEVHAGDGHVGGANLIDSGLDHARVLGPFLELFLYVVCSFVAKLQRLV